MANKRVGSTILVGTVVFVARILSGQDDVSSQRFLSRVAANINQDLPRMVDDVTELYGTEGAEGLLSANYRIVSEELSGADFDIAWAEVEMAVKSDICAFEDFRDLLDEDVTLRMNYADSNYNHLQSFDIVSSDCS